MVARRLGGGACSGAAAATRKSPRGRGRLDHAHSREHDTDPRAAGSDPDDLSRTMLQLEPVQREMPLARLCTRSVARRDRRHPRRARNQRAHAPPRARRKMARLLSGGGRSVYTHRDLRTVLAQLQERKIHRGEEIPIYTFGRGFIGEVAEKLQRSRADVSLGYRTAPLPRSRRAEPDDRDRGASHQLSPAKLHSRGGRFATLASCDSSTRSCC